MRAALGLPRRPGPGRSGSARRGASSCPLRRRRRRGRGKPCASPPRAPPPPHRAELRPGPRPRLQRPLQAQSAARASGRRRPRRLARSLAGPAHGERRAGAIGPRPLTRTTSTRRAAPPRKPAPRADPRALGHPGQVRARRSPGCPAGAFATDCHFSVFSHRVHPSPNSQFPMSSCKAKFKPKVPACPPGTQACITYYHFSVPTPGFHPSPYSRVLQTLTWPSSSPGRP